MRRVALDTSAYSAFKRGHPGIVEELRKADQIFVNPIVLGELGAGFLKGSRTQENQKELEAFLNSPRVFPRGIDEETASRYAAILTGLRALGRPIPTNGVWIAAFAMQHGLRLLTSDAHFLAVSQIVVDHFPA